MTDMVLPQFGMGMADGTIIAWHKAVGDTVRQGEPLCDVEAAKTTVEVGAPCDGVLLQILVPIGNNVPVNTVIAVIGEAGVGPLEVTQAPAAAPPPSPAPVAVPVAVTSIPAARAAVPHHQGKCPQVEPRARRAARERGLNLDSIIGSGPGGRITEEDVLASALPVPSPIASPQPVAPASVAMAAPRSTGPVFQVLRMVCDGKPLFALLDAVARAAGPHIPLAAVMVKAVAAALAATDLGEFPLLVRSEEGGLLALPDPTVLSAGAIERSLAPVEPNEAGLVIEPLAEDGLIESFRFDPSCAASLSVSVTSSDGTALMVGLVLADERLPRSAALRFLEALRDRLERPLAILT